ncbi:MAG: magnesium-translocating P-type ATPase [Candidatus Firestonebacteria bacterium]|nr:magnesium-translocating P-type ATPase [Candidatus Firestonebacteria bacterium]
MHIHINKTLKSQAIDFDCFNCRFELLFAKLKSSEKGLTGKKARARLEEYGYNEPSKKKKRAIILNILSKFINPLVIVLLFIGVFSFFFSERISAYIVFIMILISVGLTYIQEYRSSKAAEKLSEMVRTNVTVYRDGRPKEIPIKEVVPGDIVDLFAGDMIPADLRLISVKDLFVNQATLTGESMPIEKVSSAYANKTGTEAENIVFMGSSVVSGTALGIVIKTGQFTQFGNLATRLAAINIESSFEKGVNKFVMIMIRIMIVLVVAIFCINAFAKGNLVEAFLFAIAVAVGLAPEMLPLIVTINLSKGALTMSKKQVIVKRLNSIQNFGAMDVLCTDKTGTLTMDKIILERYCNVVKEENVDVLKYAFLNSHYQTGLKNLLDKAVLNKAKSYKDILEKQYKKVDEIPFDFQRKLMSVVVEAEGKHTIISKGAPEEIFKRCTKYELDGELLEFEHLIIADLKEEYDNLSKDGFRVIAIAYKQIDYAAHKFSKEDESELVLKGYVAFLDPPKDSTREALVAIKKLGIEVKVLTGDNELVTRKICSEVGLNIFGMATGDQVEMLNDDELKEVIKITNVFARLSPAQKERIVRALRANGKTVGFLGDGINDALALKAADVGISVNNAADIAKESADIILLQKSLLVLEDGIIEGRRTFGNIIKYIKMSSSSNFGNMFSMTGGSLFLPFLPMAPLQVLLNNFLYDISQTAIPSDSVDKEYLSKPRKWDVKSIQSFMINIGPISSIFDFLTYGVMWFVFDCKTIEKQALFHTGWFIESLATQTLVVYIIRTGKIPFLESRPSKFLVFTTLAIVGTGIYLTMSPFAAHLGFVTLPPLYFAILSIMLFAYLFLVFSLHRRFLKKHGEA